MMNSNTIRANSRAISPAKIFRLQQTHLYISTSATIRTFTLQNTQMSTTFLAQLLLYWSFSANPWLFLTNLSHAKIMQRRMHTSFPHTRAQGTNLASGNTINFPPQDA